MLFEDKYEAIQVTLKDIDGNEKTYKTVMFTGKLLQEISRIENSKDDKYKKNPTDRFFDMLELYFGVPGDEFKLYSFELLKSVMEYITEQIKKKN